MPIRIVCTGCNKNLKLGDKFAGKKIKCPSCQTVLAVPAPGADDDLSIQPLEDHASGYAGVTSSDSARMAAVKAASTPAGFCPQCGEQVPGGAFLCPKCGTNVLTGEVMPVASQSKSRHKGFSTALAVKVGIAVVLLFVAWKLVGGYIVGRKPQPAPVDTSEANPGKTTAKKDDPSSVFKETAKPKAGVTVKPKTATKPKTPPKPAGPSVQEKFDAAMAKVADPLERDTGIKEIRALGTGALPFIKENLKNEDPSIRWALAACLGGKPFKDVIEDIKILIVDADPSVRKIATETLRAYRAANIQACAELAKSEDADAREAAVRAISINKDAEQAVAVATEAAGDADAGVRYAAIAALSTDLVNKADPGVLINALDDDDMDTAEAASQGLLVLRRKVMAQVAEAVDPTDSKSGYLCWKILRFSPSKEMRERIAGEILKMRGRNTPNGNSIGKGLITTSDHVSSNMFLRRATNLRKVDIGLSPFLALVLTEDVLTRRRAVRALRTAKDDYILFPLIMVLGDKDSIIVDEAMQILARQEASESFLNILSAASRSRNMQRRIFASGLLAKFGEGKAADAVLSALRDTTLPGEIRGVAAKLLADLGDKRALEALELYIQQPKISQLEKLGYLVAAARLGRTEGYREVTEILTESRDNNARLAAARALGDVKEEEIVTILTTLFKDVTEREDVRVECLRSIVRTQGDKAAPLIVSLFGKVTGKVKAAINDTLTDLGAAVVTPAAEVLKKGDPRARAHAMEVLSALGDNRSLNALLSILKDPKAAPILKKQADTALSKATGQRFLGNVRSWDHFINPKARLDLRGIRWTRSRSGGSSARRCANIEYPSVWSGSTTAFLGKRWPGSPGVVLKAEYSGTRIYKGSTKAYLDKLTRGVLKDLVSGKPHRHIKVKSRSFSHRLTGRFGLSGFIYTDEKKKQTRLTSACVIPAKHVEARIQFEAYCASNEWDYYWPLFQKMYRSIKLSVPDAPR